MPESQLTVTFLFKAFKKLLLEVLGKASSKIRGKCLLTLVFCQFQVDTSCVKLIFSLGKNLVFYEREK